MATGCERSIYAPHDLAITYGPSNSAYEVWPKRIGGPFDFEYPYIDIGRYTCMEAYVDKGCAYGYEVDPEDPTRCRPTCGPITCPEGYAYYPNYDGVPDEHGPGPFCIKRYEAYFTTPNYNISWARGVGRILYAGGPAFWKYDDQMPEQPHYTGGMGPIAKAGGVLHSFEVTGPELDEITGLRHCYTEDDGIHWKPTGDGSGPRDVTYVSGVYRGNAQPGADPDLDAYLAATASNYYVRFNEVDFAETYGASGGFVLDRKANELSIALWRDNVWYLRKVVLKNYRANDLEVGEETQICEGDPSMGGIHHTASALEFICYTLAGDAVLWKSEDGGDTWS